MITQQRLRDIAWEVGERYPIPFVADWLVLNMVHPRLGHVHWHVRGPSVDALRQAAGDAAHGAPLVVRIYDVTDVIFDGFNAHRLFDIEVAGLAGGYYFGVDRTARNYVAEIGLRCADGGYRALARSATVFFDRDRPAGNVRLDGLFVSRVLRRMFPVENIFDAPVYEQMHRELLGIVPRGAVAVATLFLDPWADAASPLRLLVGHLAERLGKFGVTSRLFTSPAAAPAPGEAELLATLDAVAAPAGAEVRAAHAAQPFDLVHAHDWYSAGVGSDVARALRLPLVLSLHSTEHERTQGNLAHPLSAAIAERERAAALAADLVVVPHSATRQQLLRLYGAQPDRVVVIPDVLDLGGAAQAPDAGEIKRRFHLNPDAPLVLFAGEMSHAAGADLLMEAVSFVCRSHGSVQFVFAGEGPLRGELESRAWHQGLGHRCRFFGDVSAGVFEALLAACEFVVIPARTWQDAALAQLAIDHGRPVLTTHQAGIHCVVHGQNGLVTYDNPGSIVWGLQELLANPLRANMLRHSARQRAAAGPSLESVAAQHYLHYEVLLHRLRGASDA